MSFSELYITYYPKLVRFAKEFVLFEEDAENIIQDVFTDLWEKRDFMHHVENMNAYLFRLVKNRCLDYLKHKIFEKQYVEYMLISLDVEPTSSYAHLEAKDTEMMIRGAIDSLPKRCREIFLLSRLEKLKYREISERLGLSVNTVECQMGIALKRLRNQLGMCLAA